MAGILAITTLMAGLFGLLRACGAHPSVYVYLGFLSLITCLVQMRYGEVPRIASFIAGAITLPIAVIGAACVLGRPQDIVTTVVASPFVAMAGAFFGYLAGACTAGVFLLMDLLEPYLPGGGTRGPRYAQPERPIQAQLAQPTEDDGKPPIAWNPPDWPPTQPVPPESDYSI